MSVEAWKGGCLVDPFVPRKEQGSTRQARGIQPLSEAYCICDELRIYQLSLCEPICYYGEGQKRPYRPYGVAVFGEIQVVYHNLALRGCIQSKPNVTQKRDMRFKRY